MQRDKPHLAGAHEPFTPMTRKGVKPSETPYEPLKLNDLATPKVNKSLSGSISDDSDDHDIDTHPTDELSELRHAMMTVVGIIDRMRVSKEKRSIATQTTEKHSSEVPAIPKRTAKASRPPTRAFENTEVLASDISPRGTPVAHGASSSHGSRSTGRTDLDNRMREMSLLLKRLEYQLDEMQ